MMSAKPAWAMTINAKAIARLIGWGDYDRDRLDSHYYLYVAHLDHMLRHLCRLL